MASAGGELRQNQVLHGKAGQVAALDNILGRGDGAGDDVHLHFQADAAHAQGIFYAVLVVDDIFLGYDVNEVPVGGDGYGLGGVDGPGDVVSPHLFVPDGDHAVRVEALDMGPCYPREAAPYLDARHKLRFFERLFYGDDRAVDIDHYPSAEAR